MDAAASPWSSRTFPVLSDHRDHGGWQPLRGGEGCVVVSQGIALGSSPRTPHFNGMQTHTQQCCNTPF